MKPLCPVWRTKYWPADDCVSREDEDKKECHNHPRHSIPAASNVNISLCTLSSTSTTTFFHPQKETINPKWHAFHVKAAFILCCFFTPNPCLVLCIQRLQHSFVCTDSLLPEEIGISFTRDELPRLGHLFCYVYHPKILLHKNWSLVFSHDNLVFYASQKYAALLLRRALDQTLEFMLLRTTVPVWRNIELYQTNVVLHLQNPHAQHAFPQERQMAVAKDSLWKMPLHVRCIEQEWCAHVALAFQLTFNKCIISEQVFNKPFETLHFQLLLCAHGNISV